MAINTWKLWEWLGFKKRVEHIDVDKDIDALVMYLGDVHYDVEELLKLFARLVKLRKEAKVLSDEEALKENMRRQIELYDRLLLRYEEYDEDAIVNGIRVKNIATEYVEEAKKNRFYAALEKMRNESRWYFDW
ncbi:hypothetical protein HY497_02230 [Candidatus Woesearchaeota archaeon]|nr:hypothetical protein [Candidatus Woesearchaeota archaeon]